MEYKNISMVGDVDTVRYLLKKEGKRILYVIGINPSTANEKAVAAEPKPSKQNYAEHKELQKKIRKAEKAVKESEARIASMEKRVRELDELFMKPENAANMELVTEYTSTKETLDKENENWLLLSEKLEELRTRRVFMKRTSTRMFVLKMISISLLLVAGKRTILFLLPIVVLVALISFRRTITSVLTLSSLLYRKRNSSRVQ